MKINNKSVKVVYNLLKKRNYKLIGLGSEFDIFGSKIFQSMLRSGFDTTTLFLGNLVFNHHKNDPYLDSIINRIIKDIRFTYFVSFSQTNYSYSCSCNKGFYDCDNCSYGLIECPYCSEIEDGEVCPGCSGEGHIECSECEGLGEISCPDCEGGRIDGEPYVDIHVYAAYSLNNDVNNYIRKKLEKNEHIPFSELRENDDIKFFCGKNYCLSIVVEDYGDYVNNTICLSIDEKYHNKTFVLKQFDSSDVKLRADDRYNKFLNIRLYDPDFIEDEIYKLFRDESIEY
jgi:hypothetical protein